MLRSRLLNPLNFIIALAIVSLACPTRPAAAIEITIQPPVANAQPGCDPYVEVPGGAPHDLAKLEVQYRTAEDLTWIGLTIVDTDTLGNGGVVIEIPNPERSTTIYVQARWQDQSGQWGCWAQTSQVFVFNYPPGRAAFLWGH